MSEQTEGKRELPPEAMGNEKWHDTTHAVWMRSSLSKPDSEAVVEVAEFDDGFRAVRDGKSPEKGTLFFTPPSGRPSSWGPVTASSTSPRSTSPRRRSRSSAVRPRSRRPGCPPR